MLCQSTFVLFLSQLRKEIPGLYGLIAETEHRKQSNATALSNSAHVGPLVQHNLQGHVSRDCLLLSTPPRGGPAGKGWWSYSRCTHWSWWATNCDKHCSCPCRWRTDPILFSQITESPHTLTHKVKDSYGNKYDACCTIVKGHYLELVPQQEFLYYINSGKDVHRYTLPTVCPPLEKYRYGVKKVKSLQKSAKSHW